MDPWLVMVAQLPAEDPSARMRVLRKLESLGAGVLREGAYALPDTPANRKSLDELAAHIGISSVCSSRLDDSLPIAKLWRSKRAV